MRAKFVCGVRHVCVCAQRVVVIKFHSCNQRVVCGIRRQIKFAVRYGNISSMAQII